MENRNEVYNEVMADLKVYSRTKPFRFLSDSDLEEFLHFYKYKLDSPQFQILEKYYLEELKVPRPIFSILRNHIE